MNEKDCWETWLDRYTPRLLLFARRWVTCHADAEEVVQEAFVRFWRSGRFRDVDAEVSLFAYVKRCALDFLRSNKRRRRREEMAAQARCRTETLFETGTDREELREAVEGALRRLPGEQREVVTLRIWGGLTFPQIAKVADISHNTAASRYRYALAALHKQLAPLRKDVV